MKTAKLVLGIIAIVIGAFLLLSFSVTSLIVALPMIAAGIVGLCTRKNAPGGYTAAVLFFAATISAWFFSDMGFIACLCLAFGIVFLVGSVYLNKNKDAEMATVLWLVFFFPIGLAWMWSKTKWHTVLKILITIFFSLVLVLFIACIGTAVGQAQNAPTDASTSPSDISETESTEASTEPAEPIEETEPEIPEYILYTLTEELLFYDVDLVKEPAEGEGVWDFTGNYGNYDLTVTTEDDTVSSVIMDDQHVLYEDGRVVTTIEDYEFDEYKKKCREISYKDLARNPDSYEGEYFTFTGEVIQVYDDGYYTILRINVTPYVVGSSTYYKDTIYAKVHLEDGADRILEDDIITVWGSCSGLVTYESIFGEQISIPGLSIAYYEIVS